MEEYEFRRLLEQFPIVRSRNYCEIKFDKLLEDIGMARILSVPPSIEWRMVVFEHEADSNEESSSHSTETQVTEWQDAWSDMDKKTEPKEIDYDDPFWQKLRSAAEEKVGPTKADELCKAFQTVHKQLVYEKLSLDAARKFIGAKGNSW